jgi:hypothetical protein
MSEATLNYSSTVTDEPARPSRGALWTGRVLSGLVVAFLLMDGVMKLIQPEVVKKGTTELGFPLSSILPLGVILILSTLLYAFPKTAVLGAILLTGYLGGAVCVHVWKGHPMFSHTLIPVYLGAIAWLGLVLRDNRVRALLPISK